MGFGISLRALQLSSTQHGRCFNTPQVSVEAEKSVAAHENLVAQFARDLQSVDSAVLGEMVLQGAGAERRGAQVTRQDHGALLANSSPNQSVCES